MRNRIGSLWRTLACALALLAAFAPQADARRAAQQPASAAAAGTTAVSVRIEGPLDVGHQALLKRGIEAARAARATLVVELDTPGGEIGLMHQLGRQIRAANEDLRTVAWVDDMAASAGALLALSCEHIYMQRAATIGSATPIQLGPSGVLPISDDAEVREKMYSELRAEFRAAAESTAKPAVLAEAMVGTQVEVRLVQRGLERVLMSGKEFDDAQARGEALSVLRTVCHRQETLNLTGGEAFELGLATGLAETRAELLGKLGLEPGASEQLLRTRSEDLVALLDRFGWLLLLLGLLCAWIELKSPGFGLPGVLSIVCFALLLVGRYMAGLADVPHIVAVSVGALLVACEVLLLPGTIWPGLLGIALIVGGLLLSDLGPGFDLHSAFDQRTLLNSAFQLLASAFAGLAGALVISRFLPRAPLFNRLALAPAGNRSHFGGAVAEAGASQRETPALLGELGSARTALRPVGKVALDAHAGAEFEAQVSGAALDAGARVIVVGQSAGRLLVEPASGA